MKSAKDKGVKAIDRVRGYLRSPAALRLLICVIGTAVLTMLFEIAIVPVRYDLKVGMVPSNTIAATKDVEHGEAARRGRRRRQPDLPFSGRRDRERAG